MSDVPAQLIWINGPPGVGKSTIARRFADDHPLTLLLDVDLVRDQLGDWPSAPLEAGLAARALATAMAREHLRSGRDVVVPQFLARPEFADELRSVADATQSRYVEIVLTVDAEMGEWRFDARGPVTQTRWQAESYPESHARLQTFLHGRPDVVVVRADEDDIDATYARVLAAIG